VVELLDEHIDCLVDVMLRLRAERAGLLADRAHAPILHGPMVSVWLESG
jgi:hypothetical protein